MVVSPSPTATSNVVPTLTGIVVASLSVFCAGLQQISTRQLQVRQRTKEVFRPPLLMKSTQPFLNPPLPTPTIPRLIFASSQTHYSSPPTHTQKKYGVSPVDLLDSISAIMAVSIGVLGPFFDKVTTNPLDSS